MSGATATSHSRRQLLKALSGVVLWPFGDEAHSADRLHERRFLFGSPVDLIVRPGESGTAAGATSMAEVMAGLTRLNREWNAWKPGELGRLNQALREGRSLRIAPDLLVLIRLAQRMETLSGGLFNAGVGGAVGAWGFHDDVLRPGTRPEPAALAGWLQAAPSLRQLEVQGEWVRSRNPLLQLDFGAIGKGVAIDRALNHLNGSGLANAVVNLGGNLAAVGDAGSRPWQVGIRDPHGEGLLALVGTRGREAVVTSGSYERYRVLDGERMSHIIDPRSATPAPDLVSVTVLHGSATLADAAATALLVAGPRRWRKVAKDMGVNQVLVVARSGRAEVTSTLAARLLYPESRLRGRPTVVA